MQRHYYVDNNIGALTIIIAFILEVIRFIGELILWTCIPHKSMEALTLSFSKFLKQLPMQIQIKMEKSSKLRCSASRVI